MLTRRGILAISITAFGTAVVLPRLGERISLIFFTGLAGVLACLTTYWRIRAHRAERETPPETPPQRRRRPARPAVVPPVVISNPRKEPRRLFPWRQGDAPTTTAGRDG